MVSRETLARVLPALQRAQPTQPPVPIRLVSAWIPAPRREEER